MSDSTELTQQQNVLRWGGLAGLLAGLLFILTIIQVTLFAPADPAGLAEWVTRFPDIKAALVVENLMYLTALTLTIPLVLALFWAMWRTNLAPALFGSVLALVGLAAMMFSATPHVAHAPLADLYFAPGAAPADQASLALMWQAIWGVFDAPLYVGFFVLPAGFLVLGLGMFGSPTFGRIFGGLSVVLGLSGLVAAVLQMIDPASMIGAVSYFALIIFCLVLGWKVFGLSQRPLEARQVGIRQGNLHSAKTAG